MLFDKYWNNNKDNGVVFLDKMTTQNIMILSKVFKVLDWKETFCLYVFDYN